MDDNDSALDCKRARARDGVAIMMSGLSDRSVLKKDFRSARNYFK